jgi:hypothetical protein
VLWVHPQYENIEIIDNDGHVPERGASRSHGTPTGPTLSDLLTLSKLKSNLKKDDDVLDVSQRNVLF